MRNSKFFSMLTIAAACAVLTACGGGGGGGTASGGNSDGYGNTDIFADIKDNENLTNCADVATGATQPNECIDSDYTFNIPLTYTIARGSDLTKANDVPGYFRYNEGQKEAQYDATGIFKATTTDGFDNVSWTPGGGHQFNDYVLMSCNAQSSVGTTIALVNSPAAEFKKLTYEEAAEQLKGKTFDEFDCSKEDIIGQFIFDQQGGFKAVNPSENKTENVTSDFAKKYFTSGDLDTESNNSLFRGEIYSYKANGSTRYLFLNFNDERENLNNIRKSVSVHLQK